ncbi:tRNA-dihydrouridine(47) synthase [NAD(P)(+)]-like [Drosophila guanche]|uniref:tRNA-dihydrouridine(47) synthase [NAD(P)(+)] n=1 Tax=Drosophila guanche TaxID=7266 RepID=A0A3B0KJK1_DROGU|nr:tRNA-dihydrouridine(47) synthase [NAD(P)(+)]-like [Drosophila guanche]SPP85936.1 blast:tRNA-dihydrouridine(47) synthase [Drosophila guanche]
MEPGICYIKPEYLLTEVSGNSEAAPAESSESNKRKRADGETEDSGGKRDSKKDRKRGQNKNRPVFKEDRYSHLCHSLIDGPGGAPCALANCRYVHDLDAFLAAKGEDLGSECYVYATKGYCGRGVTCRFSKAHTDDRGVNIKKENCDAKTTQTTFNGITPDLQVRLRKHEYNLDRSKLLIAVAEKIRDARKERELQEKKLEVQEKNLELQKKINQQGDITIDHEAEAKAAEGPAKEDEKTIGSAVDDSPVGRDADRKTAVDFREKLVLSPLTTVGNLPFRRICKELGADITCGEMACAVPLLKGLGQEWALTKRHESEDIFGVQLCGNNPNVITQAAQVLQETAKVDYIDLNIGCPIDLIYQQGGGSALMRRTNILELVVRSCASLSEQLPFTVKMRTGIYADKSVAHELVPLVEEWGASAVTLHGRSREQRYTKHANWEYIEQCAATAKQMPVIGNGDILSFEDYMERRALAPHVSSVMIGRGALIKPWIFQEIKEKKAWSPTSTQRFEMLRRYCNYGLEHWGSDTKGVESTRRFLLEWQSFLYRYIPEELQLSPPQKINARPQKYRGRDEMETLMSSGNAADWVKLSEMLLGRVPEGFSFVPKHKANAF